MNEGMISVDFISNDERSYNGPIEVEAGITARQLFVQRYGDDVDTRDFTVRVNQVKVRGDYVLQSGDRMTVSPNKMAGA